MKIPLINSDAALLRSVRRALARANRSAEPAPESPTVTPFELVPVEQQRRAVEYIDYQMPPQLLVNFSDERINAFSLMKHVTEDPWLNHGAIIALYSGNGVLDRITAVKDSNIILHLPHADVERQLPAVLNVVRANQHILMHRALQNDLLRAVNGQFMLTQDLLLVPAYANLVANYLYNVGFVDSSSKARISLALTEMLANAIEHGNCGIDFEEKRKFLQDNRSIHKLIARKRRNPAVRDRRVLYRYELRPGGSRHVIRDEGKGFDWRVYLRDGSAGEAHPDTHGRGILIARHSADRMTYNETGNEVTLEFRHQPSAAVIPRVLRDNEVLDCEPGDVIVRQDEVSDSLFYVAYGEFRVLVNGRHVANLTPADVLIGEMSMLMEETRSATVIANTPGRLIRIGREDFIRIIKEHPYYGLFIAKLLARRLHRLGRGILA